MNSQCKLLLQVFIFAPIIMCNAQLYSFNLKATFVDKMCPNSDIKLTTTASNDIACVRLCTGTNGCYGVIYYHGNGTCVGVGATRPSDDWFESPGAEFYKLAKVESHVPLVGQPTTPSTGTGATTAESSVPTGTTTPPTISTTSTTTSAATSATETTTTTTTTVITSTTDMATTTTTASCLPGWVYLGDSCYFVIMTLVRVDASLGVCETSYPGSHSLQLETEAEDVMMRNYLQTTYGPQKWCLGLMDWNHDGVWRWIATNVTIGYVYWDIGEPQGGQYFSMIYQGTWHDINDYHVCNQVCEKGDFESVAHCFESGEKPIYLLSRQDPNCVIVLKYYKDNISKLTAWSNDYDIYDSP